MLTFLHNSPLANGFAVLFQTMTGLLLVGLLVVLSGGAMGKVPLFYMFGNGPAETYNYPDGYYHHYEPPSNVRSA